MYLSSLKNKNVIITGCNKGIGKATLEDFAKYGANIFACARTTSSEFKKFIIDLKKKYRVNIQLIKLDLSNTSSIPNCVNEIYKIWLWKSNVRFYNGGKEWTYNKRRRPRINKTI